MTTLLIRIVHIIYNIRGEFNSCTIAIIPTVTVTDDV